MIEEWVRRGEKVAVLAIDPSSPKSGGALLGDRMRMSSADAGESVFIRSLATRNHPGGLMPFLDSGIAFVYEDHNKYTGLGSILSQFICEKGLKVKVVTFGADNYAYSGKPDEVLKLMKLDPISVAESIKKSVK
jgi:deoxyxylulose-5-phosphate synthase